MYKQQYIEKIDCQINNALCYYVPISKYDNVSTIDITGI